jgi:hypothetical protein
MHPSVWRGLCLGAICGMVVAMILVAFTLAATGARDLELWEVISLYALLLGLPLSPLAIVMPAAVQDMPMSVYISIALVVIDWALIGAALGFIRRKPTSLSLK